MNTIDSLQGMTPTPETILRRIAEALGHPKGKSLTLGEADSLADIWVRAIAIIGRHVGAEKFDPMSVAAAVEDRIAGRPVAPRVAPTPPTPVLLVPPPVPVPAPTPMQQAEAEVRANLASMTQTTQPGQPSAFARDGQLYVHLAGVTLRVTKLDLLDTP